MRPDDHVPEVHELFNVNVGGVVLTGNDENISPLLGYTFREFCHHQSLACATGPVDEADTILQNATIHGKAFSLNNAVGRAVLTGNDEAIAILLAQSAVA